jgi:hypothetical protein
MKVQRGGQDTELSQFGCLTPKGFSGAQIKEGAAQVTPQPSALSSFLCVVRP